VRNEKRSDATGTLVAKLKADGRSTSRSSPRARRDIDRGGFFRMDGQVGTFGFRDILPGRARRETVHRQRGQSNDTMLNGAAAGNSGGSPTLGSCSGVGVNAPASLSGNGSLPVLLPTTNGILSLADGPTARCLASTTCTSTTAANRPWPISSASAPTARSSRQSWAGR
jgi:hypothetical protein